MQVRSEAEEAKNLRFAYEQYAVRFPNQAIRVRTALLRYLLPYKGFNFNFQIVVGEKLSSQKIYQGLELAAKIELSDLFEIERVLAWQAEVFETLNVSKEVRRPNKYYVKHLLNWCKDQGWLQPKQLMKWEVPQSLPSPSKVHHKRGAKELQSVYDRQILIKYSVNLKLASSIVQIQLAQFEAFWTDSSYAGNRPISKTIEQSTHQEHYERLSYFIGWRTLNKLEYYQQMRERARARKESNPKYDSEWLKVDAKPPSWLEEMHEKYPPRALETLELEEIIPIIEIQPDQLNIELTDGVIDNNYCSSSLLQKIQDELKAQHATLSFDTIIQLGQSLQQNQTFAEEVRKLNQITAREIAKEKANSLMKQACNRIRDEVKSFFKWLSYHHNPTNSPEGYRIAPSYRALFCTSLLNLAKFFYRDITNSRNHPDYKDIELVMELRNLRKEEMQADFKPNPVNPVKRNPTWRELGQLLRELLVACAPRHQIDQKTEHRSMGGLREQTSVAVDFQKYLIMMFFRVISPDRQHVVRELRLHDTLKLCWLNWESQEYEEAPWNKQNKRYQAFYNPYTRLYYLNPEDVKDEKGNTVEKPQGKPFAWVVFLDAGQTKIDQENAYRVPKIYNSELEAWLNGREDYSGKWLNWPKRRGRHQHRWNRSQYHWCGYVDTENDEKAGFREIFKPQHDYVFTMMNGKPFTSSNMCRLYDAILWRHLGIRGNPHGARSASTGHFKLIGMTAAENESLAQLKGHSVKTQDSRAYNKLTALEKTAKASELLVNDFLQDHGLDPEKYGLV